MSAIYYIIVKASGYGNIVIIEHQNTSVVSFKKNWSEKYRIKYTITFSKKKKRKSKAISFALW